MAKIAVITNVAIHEVPTPVHAIMAMSWALTTGCAKVRTRMHIQNKIPVHIILQTKYLYTSFLKYACLWHLEMQELIGPLYLHYNTSFLCLYHRSVFMLCMLIAVTIMRASIFYALTKISL